MKKTLAIILVALLIIAPFFTWIYTGIQNLKFNATCGDYLKLAADANSVELAEKHLSTALTYLEENNLTSGYTKIFIYKPSNDIGLWYDNLKTAHTQLVEMLDAGYTELEQSNMLMKLRETILDDGGALTHPMGISHVHIFTLMFWLNVTLWLPCWFFAGFIGFEIDYM